MQQQMAESQMAKNAAPLAKVVQDGSNKEIEKIKRLRRLQNSFGSEEGKSFRRHCNTMS